MSGGAPPSPSERDQFVALLRSFHATVWPTLRALARDAHGDDPSFTDRFDAWVDATGAGELTEADRFTLAAKQYGYRLATDVLFDAVLDEQPSAPDETLDALTRGLDESPVFTAFPQNATTRRAVEQFRTRVDPAQLARVEDDVLGDVYEAFIPSSERTAHGQFYTDPDVAAAICQWAIQPRDDRVTRVLDPAAGSGTFPVAAYHRLQEVAPSSAHQDRLDSIVAVDVDPFALRLTALNLAARSVRAPTRAVHAIHDSFFDVSPRDGRLPFAVGTDDGVGPFDVVVGNPPYIRQENLSPDAEHFRAHLRSFGSGDDAAYDSGARSLSRKSDAYVYFVTHALQFLREGGRLGVVVPAKWLTTRYGEPFQEFLYDQTKVHAVVGFSDRAFSALVDTVLLFVERCGDGAARRATTTDFVHVDRRLEPATLASVAGRQRSVPDGQSFAVETHDAYRVVSVPQRRLEDQGGGKLGHYLYGPTPFIRLVESQRLRRLDTFADVAFGNKTGNNGFFLLDEADVAEWGIDERFLHPAVRSMKDLSSLRLETTDQYLLDFDAYVEAVAARHAGETTDDLETLVTDALRADGYHATLRYLEHGDAEGVPEGRTVAHHTPWFNLGELRVPDVLHPVFYDERVFTVENTGGFAPTNAIQCVDVTDHADVLPAILNSTVYRILLELWGRHEGGGALQLLTYEVASVPVPNPDLLSDGLRDRIVAAGRALTRGVDGAQDDLDEALLEFLDLDLSVETLQAVHRRMVAQRVDGAATERVLVGTVVDVDALGPGAE
jgi:methylase of polypeptide subunit release factors